MNHNHLITFVKMEMNDPMLDQILSTYESSFPENERRDFSLVRKLIAEEPEFSVYALINENIYIGFITIWKFDTFSYVEHFAIESTARNGGFGAKVMQQFLETADTVVLEVETPSDELARRRIGFYERFGFVLAPQTYFQPPYQDGGNKVEMKLMSYGNINLNDSFDEVCKTLYKYVYKQPMDC